MSGGLGRRPAPDHRDHAFLLRAVIPEAPPERTWRYWWDGGWWGDQGNTPHCVAYSWLHFLEDGPITRAPRAPGVGPVLDPKDTYDACQLVDEWPGTDYDGTSVRAGAKVLQSHGMIGAYRWGWTITDLTDAVLHVGPVVVGTWWYDGMDRPDADGVIQVSGGRRGGHAYVVNGVNLKTGFARIKNSWGRGWARNGRALIPLEDLEGLIHDFGEVCLPTELP